MTRHDVPAAEVARRWLDGETYAELAVAFDTTPWTIGERLKKARILFPELPWNDRTPPPSSRTVSPTREFLSMKDGKAGTQDGKSARVVDRSGRHKI